MNPGLKYSLGRIGIFVVCAVPAILLFPNTNLFLRLMIALIISAVASFFLLRRWRDEVAEQMSSSSRRRVDQKERLRSALAGDEATEHSAEGATEGASEDARGDKKD